MGEMLKDKVMLVTGAGGGIGRDIALAAAQARIEKLRERLTEAVGEVQSIDEAAMGAAQARLISLREEAEREAAQRRGVLVMQAGAGQGTRQTVPILGPGRETLFDVAQRAAAGQAHQHHLAAARAEFPDKRRELGHDAFPLGRAGHGLAREVLTG